MVSGPIAELYRASGALIVKIGSIIEHDQVDANRAVKRAVEDVRMRPEQSTYSVFRHLPQFKVMVLPTPPPFVAHSCW